MTGIIDWQYSGFHPTYYEFTKVMNSPNETNDWFSWNASQRSGIRRSSCLMHFGASLTNEQSDSMDK